MILDDYINYQNDYTNKYGEKTVVVIQVGDFFELYAYHENEELIGPDLPRICDLCNLQLTRKNKAIVEATSKNPMMAGFPLYIISKHVQTLTNAGFTVVVVRQVTAPPNPKRDVTDVFSPATHLQPSQREGTYLMVMMWGRFDKHTAVGMAAVDVSSGETMVYETASMPEDEAIRWMSTFAPKELVILGDGYDASLFANASMAVHWNWKGAGCAIEKIAYQNELFQRAFDCKSCGLVSPIEAIGLCHTELARIALAALLQFLHEHDESLVQQLSSPRFLSPQGHLHLAHNSAQQLNIIGTGDAGERPLISILNRCSTAFGARAFKSRLLHPITDANELDVQYNAVQTYIDVPENIAVIRKHLSGVQDLERMARRLSVRRFAPMEWPALLQSIEAAARALGTDLIPDQELVKDMVSIFDMNECAKYNSNDIRSNIFCMGVNPLLDSTARAFSENVASFEAHIEALGGENIVRLDVNERDGYCLTTTKRRWETTLKTCSHLSWISEVSLKPISASSSTVRLVHPQLSAQSDAAVKAAALLRRVACDAYRDWLEANGVDIAHRLRRWIAPISDLDIAVTNAKNAIDFAYTRPSFGSHNQMTISKLRHPMIERFLTNMAYVPNDVVLGGDTTGWLLYGMNAAGKSSLMKAVGLAVVMAQAGMYVPAASMTFLPFEHVFTRISGADNIYRGMSTFVVEMMELRNILQRANGPTSLVLGDELCAGTEALSAVSIVSAGVNELLRRKCPFIFATHLHELVPLASSHVSNGLRICHMHVEVDTSDEGTGGLIYDRTLRDGVGHSTYGIEVCRGLGMPASFLKEADAVRRAIQGVPSTIVSTKKSTYNASVFVDKCGVCGEPASEVHHIKYQKDAAAGKHEHVVQHHASNLVALCEACHKKEHSGELHITGWVATTQGRVLQVRVRMENRIRHTQDGGWHIRSHIARPWKSAEFCDVVKLAHKHYPEISVDTLRQLESTT